MSSSLSHSTSCSDEEDEHTFAKQFELNKKINDIQNQIDMLSVEQQKLVQQNTKTKSKTNIKGDMSKKNVKSGSESIKTTRNVFAKDIDSKDDSITKTDLLIATNALPDDSRVIKNWKKDECIKILNMFNIQENDVQRVDKNGNVEKGKPLVKHLRDKIISLYPLYKNDGEQPKKGGKKIVNTKPKTEEAKDGNTKSSCDPSSTKKMKMTKKTDTVKRVKGFLSESSDSESESESESKLKEIIKLKKNKPRNSLSSSVSSTKSESENKLKEVIKLKEGKRAHSISSSGSSTKSEDEQDFIDDKEFDEEFIDTKSPFKKVESDNDSSDSETSQDESDESDNPDDYVGDFKEITEVMFSKFSTGIGLNLYQATDDVSKIVKYCKLPETTIGLIRLNYKSLIKKYPHCDIKPQKKLNPPRHNNFNAFSRKRMLTVTGARM